MSRYPISVFSLLLCAVAPAQDDEAPASWLHGMGALGDLGGLRPELADAGVQIGGSWIADWSAAWSGGLRSRDTFRSLLDVNLTLDLDKLAGVPRLRAFVHGQRIFGRDASLDTGDLQVYSNIDGPSREQIAEASFAWDVFDQRLRFEVGKIDANNLYSEIDSAVEFLHSTAGFTPTIVAFPSFPDPAMSVNVFVSPADTVTLGVGIFDGSLANGRPTGKLGPKNFFDDGEGSDYFVISELDLAWQSGRVGFGAWHSTARFNRFDSGTTEGTEGGYVTLEQWLYREREGTDQGLVAFAQFGFTDDAVSLFGETWLAGVLATGWIPDRERDSTGFLVSYARLSDAPAAGFARDETAYELFHGISLTRFLIVRPDLQVITGAGGRRDTVVVGTLRFEVVF